MGVQTADLKQRVRAEVRSRRQNVSPVEQAELAAQLNTQLQRIVQATDARSLTCYLPVRGEPDTRPFLAWATAQRIDVLLPRALAHGKLEWVRSSGAETTPGAFGIEEPLGDSVGSLEDYAVDLVLVPAAAVDLRGTRLGWGKGYYDRELSLSTESHSSNASSRATPPVFAVVHDSDIYESLPFEPHDIAVSGAVTPSRIIRF